MEHGLLGNPVPTLPGHALADDNASRPFVRGRGRGGPNTEFALAFAAACEDVDGVWLLAADTDGQDGASGAAGALVRPGLARHARNSGRSPEKALADNDSGPFFSAFNALVTPGPTFTNVNDFRAVVIPG